MKNILVIGGGSIGERHLRCFLKTGRVTATSCDNRSDVLERLQKTYDVPVELNWEEAMARRAFDAVVVCTPAPLHIPMALRALESGAHVLLEKPLSTSMEGVDALIRMRDFGRREVAVAYIMHVYPFLVQAREFLRSGQLGPVLHATVTAGQPFHRMRPAYASIYYRDHETGGGAIQDMLTHTVNWMESVLGATDSLYCDCAHQVLPHVTVEDTAHVCARNGPVLVSYTLNQFQAPNEVTLQLNAAAGSVKIEVHRQRWGILRQGESDWTWREAPVEGTDAHFVNQANAFLDQIDGQPGRLCTVEAAAQTLRFNLAALASADTGGRVECGGSMA